MSERMAFGVVGGYGATGRNAVADLWRSSSGNILVGGRDLDFFEFKHSRVPRKRRSEDSVRKMLLIFEAFAATKSPTPV